MRTVLITMTLLLALPACAAADEILTLAAPVVKPSLTGYVLRTLTLNRSPGSESVSVSLVSPATGDTFVYTWTGATARALITGLNTANLSTKSLARRIHERLIADGALAGTITGTPD